MGNRSKKLMHFLRVDPRAVAASSATSSPSSFSSSSNSNSSSSFSDDDGYNSSSASSSPSRSSSSNSPPKSPWSHLPGVGSDDTTATGLIASLVKEGGNGKVYSLAASGDVLYTGTDSDTVRVWRGRRHVAGLRASSSGLVKAIVVSSAADGRVVVFTGHQDGKVRVWRRRTTDADAVHHRRVGSLPPLGDLLASSVNPASYVRSGSSGRRRRGRSVVWLRHTDAVSALSLDEDAGVLYSASWDGTFKAWRVSDHRCLDSVHAHDDAVNTVAAAGFAGLVLTGAADGTVKVWKRLDEEEEGDDGRTSTTRTRHELVSVLREGGDGVAVTAIAAYAEARAVYVGSSDGLVTCWRWGMDDVDGGGEPTRAAVLRAGHGTGVLCLAVSGRVVVSGAADGTLCVWRRDDGEQGQGAHARLAVLKGHTGPVKCVAVAAEDDGDEDYCDADGGERRFVVYSGSLDGSVKVWRLSEERALEPEMEPPSPAAVETAAAASPLLMMALRESSEAWTKTPRPRTAAMPSSVQGGWGAELKGVAAA